MSEPMLTGIRVVDCSLHYPGPYAALTLSDLGADVIKVEPPGGDPLRRFTGEADRGGPSFAYQALNAGKTIIELDLKRERDRGRLHALVRAADVLIESYRPDAKSRLGLDRETLAQINPDLIHLAISGWGQTGPYATRAGHDLNFMALGGGLVSLGPATQPTIPFPPIAGYAAGLQGAVAVLAALVRQGRSRGVGRPRGHFLDVSVVETVLAWQGSAINEALAGMPPGRRDRLLSGAAACYQVYKTRDNRFLSVATIERKFWIAFCNGVGVPEWIGRQWEPFPQLRLIGEVADVIRDRTLAEWRVVFAEIDCCVEPVWDWSELLEHPQLVHRGLIRRYGAEGTAAQVLLPILTDSGRPRERGPVIFSDVDSAVRAWAGALPDRESAAE